MKKLIVILMLLFPGFVFCQDQHLTDSLKQALSAAANESTRADILVKLGKIYCQSDLNLAMQYIDQSIQLSKKIRYGKRLADAYNVKGIIYINTAKPMDAISCFDSSAALMKLAGNKVGMASIYGNLGGVYFSIGDYDKSLEYHLKCLEQNEATGNKIGIAIAMEGVASVYFIQKSYVKSMQWNSKALALHREIKNISGTVPVLINIAMALCEMKKYTQSMKYYSQSLILADSLNDKGNIAEIYFGMGMLYEANEEHDEAQVQFRKSLEMFESMGNNYKSIEIYGHLANIYFEKKDYDKSIAAYQEFLADARIMGAKQYARDALKGLYECYAAKKEFEKAFDCQTKYIRVNDSIMNEEKMKQLSELHTKYETAKKEAENRFLVQENQIKSYKLNRSVLYIIGLSALLIIAIAVALFIIRNSRLRAKQRTMQLEQKLLRSQMNPHFIFNSLIAIQSFIYRNDPKEAGRYLSGFAKLIRHILENSREEYISLAKEIQTLEHYLELQKLRYDEHFDYSITVAEDIDAENIAIPPMLAQPFIENSIEHGIKNLSVKGKIEIYFSKRNREIMFEVKDNGIGIEKSIAMKQEDEEHRSLATLITRERLIILNRRKNNKIKFAIDELRDSVNNVLGTQVSFVIPYRGI